MKNLSNKVIYLILVAIAVVLGIIFGYKASFLFFGVFHLLLWANIWLTDICTAIVNRTVSNDNKLYKLLCLLIFSICAAIFL